MVGDQHFNLHPMSDEHMVSVYSNAFQIVSGIQDACAKKLDLLLWVLPCQSASVACGCCVHPFLLHSVKILMAWSILHLCLSERDPVKGHSEFMLLQTVCLLRRSKVCSLISAQLTCLHGMMHGASFLRKHVLL